MEQTPPPVKESAKHGSEKRLVVLVHGIRTSGRWMRRIKRVLESEADCVVEPAGYGFFDIFRFLLPGPTRRAVIETVKWKLLHAMDRHKDRQLIIVAHSFGTFCVTEILKDSPQIRPIRLLFCGSIVAQNFRWDSLSQMAPERGMRVVNECGARDIWPPVAHSITFGYGSSGTGGFQVPGVEDRCHDLGHSGYFTKEFVQQFWVPFIRDGTVAHPNYEEEMPEAPWWISIIGLRPLLPWFFWILLALVVCTMVFGWGLSRSNRTREVAPAVQTNEVGSTVAAITQEAQQAERYADERYQAIASVLQNPQSTVAQQIAALRELPEAMCLRVPVAVIDQNSPHGVRRDWNLPNLIRLREALREYIHLDRTKGLLAGDKTDRFFASLSPLGEASTEVLSTLHRLGPRNSAKPQHNLWTWLPKNYQSGVPRASQDDPVPEPRPKLQSGVEAVVDLGHMSSGDFERLCVPFAMYDPFRPPEWKVVFPPRASFRLAKLQGANFHAAELEEADFSETDMQRSNFLFAKMRRARFFKTNLRAVTIQSADLRGAHFEFCQANGADFNSADLSCGQVSFCGLEGSDFRGATLDWGRMLGNLAGADMRSVSLKGTALDSECAGADFSEAELLGATLGASNFGGRLLYCRVERVDGPPDASFAWPGLEKPLFDASNEAGAGRVSIRFPGAILSELRDLNTPLEYLQLTGVSRDECLQKLAEFATTKKSDENSEQAEDLLSQVRYLSDDEVSEVTWPITLEPLLKQAFGSKHVLRASRATYLLGAEFESKDGAAWMDRATLESFSKVLDERASMAARDSWDKEKLDKFRNNLSQIEPRGDYFGAWLQHRAQWSFWREFEKVNASVK